MKILFIIIITFKSSFALCTNLKQFFLIGDAEYNSLDTIEYCNYSFNKHTVLNTGHYKFSGTVFINKRVKLTIIGADITFSPNTKIIVKGKLKSSNSYLHGCSAMWDGIYLYSGSRIDLTETTVEDAKRAIVDTLGANDIGINDSWFNNNYESIILKNPTTTSANSSFDCNRNYFTNDHIPTIFTTAPVSINVSTATNPSPAIVGAYTRAHLLPPYSAINIKSYSGITLVQTKTTANNNQYVMIGDNNIFDKLHYGVVATRSKVWVRKNTFLNMDSRGDIGVFIVGASSFIQNYLNPSDAKIGGNIAEANDFYTCYNGVINQYASALTVRNNTFRFSDLAIGVSQNNRNYLVTIDRNKINATKNGVSCYNNVYINAQITENTLINAIPVGAYNTNTGINTSEVIVGNTGAKYNVYNNNINGYFNGIYATNTYSTQINENEVHLIPTTGNAQQQAGIKVENTNLPWIINNIIDKPSPDYNAVWQNGINAGTNTTPIIICNQITNMGTSMKFIGSNITIPGYGILNNSMSYGKYGIWLENSAEIGNQFLAGFFGNPNQTSNNQWFGFSNTKPQTYTSNGSNTAGGGSRMYTKNNVPTNSYFLNNANATSNGVNGATPLYGNYSYPFANFNCNANIGTPLMKMQHANNIAANTMGYTGNAANLYAISKHQLLHNIKLNNLNITADVVMKNFVDSANHTHLGQFYTVDSLLIKAIATGSTSVLTAARNLNNSIANTGNIVYSKQSLNNTYMDLLNAEPDSITLANLRDLAVKCPNLEGDAVYQARGILMYYDRTQYTSFCENDFAYNSNHRLGNTDNEVAPEAPKELSLYPNPTNKDITIEYTKGEGNEAAELTVYSQLGNIVLTKTLTDNTTTVRLDELSSGIYLYIIKQQGITLKTNKLVVAK